MSKKFAHGTIRLRPGWLIIDTSGASGGIEYDRGQLGEKPINRKRGIQTDHKTRKTVDNVEHCAAIDAVVKKVDYALRVHCARTRAGWFADDEALIRVQAEVAQIAAEAVLLNARARRAQSERAADIGIWPLRIDVASYEAVREITRTVRGVLTDIHNALREGKIAELHKLRIRAKNLDKFAVGFQSDAIRFALERAPIAVKEIREAIKRGENPANAGKRLNLEAIEAAIAHFEDSPFAQGDFDPLARIA